MQRELSLAVTCRRGGPVIALALVQPVSPIRLAHHNRPISPTGPLHPLARRSNSGIDVTLVLTINGPDTIWMLTDRRISFANRPPRDDGRKAMMLETKDGVAMLGYAGLGATAGGTEPADWMSAVLRGRNLPLEQCLGELSSALQRQFPKHLVALPVQFGAAHSILVPAFLNDEPRLYSIDLAFAPDRHSYSFRYTRHVVGPVPSDPPRTPRIGLAGSGITLLLRDRRWIRELLKLVRACDGQRIGPPVVADYLALINNRVSQGTIDNSVGPRSIVVWRHRKGSTRKGGGAHQFYNGVEREGDSAALPTIGNGMDIQALIQATMPFMMAQMSSLKEGGGAPELDREGINAVLAKLPDKPDETLA